MTENQNATGSKKKLLVPLVALLMCAVAFTGAAYAYTTSVSVSNQSLDADYISIDLLTGTPGSDIHPVTGAFTFTDNYSYSGSPVVKKDSVDCTVTTKKICTYDLKILGDATANTLVIKSDNYADLKTQAIGSTTFGALCKILVNTTDSTDGAKELDAAGTASFTISKTTSDLSPVYVYVWIQALNGGSAIAEKTTNVQAAAAVSDPSTLEASEFVALFGTTAYQFNISFEATGPTPASP